MARISLDPPRTRTFRLAAWYSRRKYGTVLDPVRAMAHHRSVLMDGARFEQRVAKWKKLDTGLKGIALMVSAARIGCSWCLDFGYWLADEEGLPLEKVRYVPQWRDHKELFGPLELQVMEYAEAMTETEPTVTDSMVRELTEQLGEAAFVELTAMIALENYRSRINAALGLTGQGFSDRCAVPMRTADDGHPAAG